MRPENFCRDASLIGVGLMLIGGLGGNMTSKVHADKAEEDEE